MRKDKNQFSRREFMKVNALAGAATLAGLGFPVNSIGSGNFHKSGLALLGGDPVRKKKWPEWPFWDPASMDEELMKVVRSGIWSRARVTEEFESQWAKILGAKRCLAVVNGTNALIASLAQLNIGGGDEVLVPPYTFIASVQAILMNGAIPIFVDIDRETFQIDPSKIEAKISKRTKAIMPVHILGLPADMPSIMEIAKKYNLFVVEDACQAHLAEINNKKVGTIGHAGCFSFQNSKNLPIGEGGAIVSDDDEFMDRCFSYNNYGNPYGAVVGALGAGTLMLGTKIRTTEYQSAIGLLQLKHLDSQTRKREENAEYLRKKISTIPGIRPYRLYNHVTRAAFHLFPFRFIGQEFGGMTRANFLRALQAEGIPCSSGYSTLNKMPYLKHAFESKNFKRMYSAKELNYEKYLALNQCPENDILCNEEAVWIPQYALLGERADMDDIFNAIEKIRLNAGKIR